MQQMQHYGQALVQGPTISTTRLNVSWPNIIRGSWFSENARSDDRRWVRASFNRSRHSRLPHFSSSQQPKVKLPLPRLKASKLRLTLPQRRVGRSVSANAIRRKRNRPVVQSKNLPLRPHLRRKLRAVLPKRRRANLSEAFLESRLTAHQRLFGWQSLFGYRPPNRQGVDDLNDGDQPGFISKGEITASGWYRVTYISCLDCFHGPNWLGSTPIKGTIHVSPP